MGKALPQAGQVPDRWHLMEMVRPMQSTEDRLNFSDSRKRPLAFYIASSMFLVLLLVGIAGATQLRAVKECSPSRQGSSFHVGWPVKGRTMLSFCFCATERTDLEIAVRRGASVRAAATGWVTFAGNDLKRYSNVIIINHCEHWITAYAGADRLLVRRGERVTRGAIIALFDRTRTKVHVLHFEMRRGSKNIDPLNYLPRLSQQEPDA